MGSGGLRIADFGVRTLSGIDFELAPGHCTGLTGPSGSGKTLLLRAIADLDPHDGQMWLNGVAADTIPVHKWRRKVGYLPTDSAWWHDTVGPHFTAINDSWLAELGFTLDVLDWQVSRLSSGERQRLALLRLLMLKPNVLLLDEPTANLDAGSMTRVERLLNAYHMDNQPTILWVSHDIEQLRRNCRSIYIIHEKRLQAISKKI